MVLSTRIRLYYSYLAIKIIYCQFYKRNVINFNIYIHTSMYMQICGTCFLPYIFSNNTLWQTGGINRQFTLIAAFYAYMDSAPTY